MDSTSFVIYPELEATEVRLSTLKRYLCSFYFRIDNKTGWIHRNTLYIAWKETEKCFDVAKTVAILGGFWAQNYEHFSITFFLRSNLSTIRMCISISCQFFGIRYTAREFMQLYTVLVLICNTWSMWESFVPWFCVQRKILTHWEEDREKMFIKVVS